MIRVPRKQGAKSNPLGQCEECHFHTGSKVDYPCPYHRDFDGGWRARPPWITKPMEQALRPAGDNTRLYCGWDNATQREVLRRLYL